MTYLLDVNVLISLGFKRHDFHERVEAWIQTLPEIRFATCAITELGFVRILAQHPDYDLTVASARDKLKQLKSALGKRLVFITDDVGVERLPAWVKHPKQTTDGHLAALAKTHGAVLATLDAKIPGVFLLPGK